MNSIWKLTQDLRTTIGFHPAGTRLYKEPWYIVPGEMCGFHYYPFNGGYSIWDRQINVESIARKIEDTDKPREYYFDRVVSFTQEQLDKHDLNYLKEIIF